MKAGEREFRFLANEGKVIIPFFQRTYVWGEENWENLLEGLSNKPDGHFLGSIILKQLRPLSGEPKKLEVVDGQQRLTTLSILIKALYDTFAKEQQKYTLDEIRQVLFSKISPSSGVYYVKIEHSQVDKDVYEKVIKANIDGNPTIALEVDKNSHKILQCYKYFCEILKEKSEDERISLFNKILNPNNKMLVVIDLEEEKDDEQTIFDTLNTAGVRLTSAEIVKNAIFQKVIKVLGNKESAIKLYDETWKSIFLSDDDTIKYWDTERSTGRLMRDNIEILLHAIGVIKGFFDPDKHTLSELSKLYKQEINKMNEEYKLKEFINEIIEYAKIYREKIITFDKTTLLSYENSIIRLLHILDVLQISTLHPFILYIFKTQRDESKIKEILLKLEKFVVYNMLAKTNEIKNYNKLCKEFIENTSKLDDYLKKINYYLVSIGLRVISNKEASLILFWIELYRRYKDPKYGLKELKYNYSLEHIMPKKWEEHWKNIPKKYKDDGSKMTDEEAKIDRNNKINWIGNMTLLTSSLNSSLRNYGFKKKMEGDGRKKGIKAYAELSISKDDIVEPYNKGDRVWDEPKIEKRTKKLQEEIEKILGMKS